MLPNYTFVTKAIAVSLQTTLPTTFIFFFLKSIPIFPASTCNCLGIRHPRPERKKYRVETENYLKTSKATVGIWFRRICLKRIFSLTLFPSRVVLILLLCEALIMLSANKSSNKLTKAVGYEKKIRGKHDNSNF